MIFDPSKCVLAVARNTPGGLVILGSSVALGGRYLATALHVVGTDQSNLAVIIPKLTDINGWQDASDNEASAAQVSVCAIDAFRDLCLLKLDDGHVSTFHGIGSADDVIPGSQVAVCGFPHANHGRTILTIQRTTVGARVLLPNGGVKSKHLVINALTQPGQSGSAVFDESTGKLVALAVGSYAPPSQGGFMTISGIDPRTLHQTAHAVSAEYIKAMLP